MRDKYNSGDKVKVLIHNHDLSQSKWERGTFLSYIPDIRGKSFNIMLQDGSIQKGVKPECVMKDNCNARTVRE